MDGGAGLSHWSSHPTPDPALPWPPGPRRGPTRALGISLLLHGLLLSLSFGGEGLGLPGLALPWQARRAEVPDLRVVLEAPSPAATPPEALAAPAIDGPAEAPNDASPAAPSRAEPALPPPAPPVLAVDKTTPAAWVVPPTPPASAPEPAPAPAPVVTAFAAASSPQGELTRLSRTGDATRAALERETRERAAEMARLDREKLEAQQMARQQAERLAEAERQETARLEAARQEAARQEALRQEAARREAARLEAARVEAARLEAARLEAARLDAERQEAARRAAAQQEAARQEAAQAEAERAQAARQEAARQEAARAEAARQAAAREAAARADAARLEAARQAAAKAAEKTAEKAAEEAQREARLRAIGQQLNEEAAKRDAARQAQPNLPSSWSSARRGRLFGRTDANAEMVLYAEAWARKIQLNQAFELLREVVRQPHTDPLVTVAIRSDGTVESVSFFRSSGVPAIDDAIRRVIESQANYPAFAPALAREYDVIEIRRTWHFDSAIRMY